MSAPTIYDARGVPMSSTDPALVCCSCGRQIWTQVPVGYPCGISTGSAVCNGQFMPFVRTVVTVPEDS